MGTQTTTELARRVDEARKKSGISVKALSESTGIARTNLQRRLKGQEAFSIPQLEAVSAQLELPFLSWFDPIAA